MIRVTRLSCAIVLFRVGSARSDPCRSLDLPQRPTEDVDHGLVYIKYRMTRPASGTTLPMFPELG